MDWRFGWAMLGLALLAAGASAQEAGQIVGVVHDQSGAGVPGARVNATEAGTGLVRTATSGSDGSYVLPNLRPTGYIVTTEASGFRSFRDADVQLQATQSLTLNINLEVGA